MSARRSIVGVAAVMMFAFVAPAPLAHSGVAAAPETQATAVKDWWITMKIHSQFVPEDALEGSNIDVDTTNGAVTLTGNVPTAAARARAMAIAKATDGVKSVADKMQIGPGEKPLDPKNTRETGRTSGRTITDGWVKSKIHMQFITEKTLEDSNIDVDIVNGAVTLNGTVKSQAGRARAVEIAKTTAGVKSVKDALKVG